MKLFCSLTLITIIFWTCIINGENRIPDEVSVKIYILDIRAIDNVNQLVTIDFAMMLKWRDATLTGKWPNGSKINILENWFPDIQIYNDFDLQKKLNERLSVDSLGNVTYMQRFYGRIISRHDFSEYPFDKYNINIEFVNIGPERLIFIEGEGTYEIDPSSYSIADWRIQAGNFSFFEKESYQGEIPGFSYELQASRKQSYFLWKIVIPLMLVVFMSWTVFWIDPSHIGAQLTVAATAMLTIIAYQFTLSDLLPKISYFTRLDVFILGSIIVIFLSLAEAIFTSNLVSRDYLLQARRMDLISRFLFPSLYCVFMLVAFVM
jgi:hypothetical protein